MEEQWKSINGFDGYEVSNHGRVRSWLRPGRAKQLNTKPVIRRLVPDKDGYMTLMLSKHGHVVCAKVHVLVLEAFHGPRPPGAVARHVLDPSPTNNRADNLAWGTPVENEADKRAHGYHQYGEANPAAKLTNTQATIIRNSTLRPKVLSELFGVTEATISRIKSGISRNVIR